MASVQLKHIYKRYANGFEAVKDFNLDIEDKEFPSYIRIGKTDVTGLFPEHKIDAWETYRYPVNRRSKTLYLIDRT